MIRSILSLALLLFAGAAGAQSPYRFTAEIDSALHRDTMPYRFQLAATDYAMIGETAAALATFDRQPSTVRTGVLDSARMAALSAYKPVGAAAYILGQAEKTRVLILNERHFQPQHRAFVSSLLPGLKERGYTLLAVEALSTADTGINSRGYALVTASGFYTNEPGFGNLLRRAMELGYRVEAYDGEAVDWKARERLQADAIAKLLRASPGAKCVVICGLDHAREDSLYMAGILKREMGIDPFTVDNVSLCERSDTAFEHPVRKAIEADSAVVLVDGSGAVFNGAARGKRFDVQVRHPATKYVDGRPDWLRAGDRAGISLAGKIRIGFPCRVMVYAGEEPVDGAVPYDVAELKSREDRTVVFVPRRGKYRIVAVGRSGKREWVK